MPLAAKHAAVEEAVVVGQVLLLLKEAETVGAQGDKSVRLVQADGLVSADGHCPLEGMGR
jgi:hypothetical protein